MYIDAFHDFKKSKIKVVERIEGQRLITEYPVKNVFYYPDDNGKHKSIFGYNLGKFETKSYKAFKNELTLYDSNFIHESDIKPVYRCLEENYLDATIPTLHTSGFDIEVDFCYERGYAKPEDPHQPITSITLSLDWMDTLITLVVPPDTVSFEEADETCQRFDDTLLFDSERDMLLAFLDLVEDVDLFYTWNGEGFDIPYTVNRITQELGRDHTKKLCLFGQYPKERNYERYGKMHSTYDLVGKVHLDYMALYKKFTFHEMHSYALNSVAEYELGEQKIEYEGTLDDLYKKDFEKFILYNRKDVGLLQRFEEKLGFIELANILAHENCVTFDATLGSVQIIDQGITIFAHRNGLRVPDKKYSENDSKIAGAYVADPKKGLHDWIGSVDINSLYPSTIRALNMSAETLVAQIRQDHTKKMIQDTLNKGVRYTLADAWNNKFMSVEAEMVHAKTDDELIVDFSDGTSETLTAREIYEWIFNTVSNLAMSSNGTIFRQDITGIIPGILADWYSDRKKLKKKCAELEKEGSNETNEQKKSLLIEKSKYYDKLQHIKKIQLNSLYGAITSANSRFSDQRIGQSTTLSGRTITKHMIAKANEILVGDYNYQGKSIVYGDTDSAYVSIESLLDQIEDDDFKMDKEKFADLCDSMAEEINNNFPEFAHKQFNIPIDKGEIIKCEREICGTKGFFVKKKRYAILYYDKEGKRVDDDGLGNLKIMGMETQRSDTSKYMQTHLKSILLKVLQGQTEEDLIDDVRELRKEIRSLDPWEKGAPKGANNITHYGSVLKKGGKATIPGHVRAALNWNKLKKANMDNYSLDIVDGQKIVVCYLRENPLKMKSIAYPVDQPHLPQWFKELPFDESLMEEKMLDKKIDNLIGILDFDLSGSKISSNLANKFVKKKRKS